MVARLQRRRRGEEEEEKKGKKERKRGAIERSKHGQIIRV